MPLVFILKFLDNNNASGIWNPKREMLVIISGDKVSPAPINALPRTMEHAIKINVKDKKRKYRAPILITSGLVLKITIISLANIVNIIVNIIAIIPKKTC